MPTRYHDNFKSFFYGLETVDAYGVAVIKVEDGDLKGFKSGADGGLSKMARPKVYNLKTSPNVELFKRMYANGGWAAIKSIVGKKSIKISFSQDVIRVPYTSSTSFSTETANGAPNIANLTSEILGPDWFEYLAACGMTPDSYKTGGDIEDGHRYSGAFMTESPRAGIQTASMAVVDRKEGELGQKALCVLGCGMIGDVKIVGDGVANMVRLDLDFEGPLSGIYDIDDPDLPLDEEAGLSPEANVSATITDTFETAHSGASTQSDNTMDIDKWEFAMNNVRSMEPSYTSSSGSGFQRNRITGSAPTFKCDPFLRELLQSSDEGQDYWNSLIEGTPHAIVVGIGSVIKLTIPYMQLVDGYKYATRNNMMSNPLVFEAKKKPGVDGTGIQLLMGVTA